MAKRAKLKSVIADALASDASVQADAEMARLRSEVASLRLKYRSALEQIDAANHRADTLVQLRGMTASRLPRPPRRSKGEATAIIVLSDWHVEELVDPATVSGRNHYTLEVADRRAAEVTARALMLIEHERRLAKIDHVVIAALGDWITGDIHDDAQCQLSPLAATRRAGEMLLRVVGAASGSCSHVTVATCTGNHGRSTKHLRIASDRHYSYEQNLYHTMAAANPYANVTYQIGEGYHNWLDLYGYRIRLHHGHAIRSNGAIGGISIAANKAIAQWNRMERADLDVFGHHHQFGWAYGRYVSNGSLVGWNAFANFIKAEFQPPSQSVVIVDSSRGVTKAFPVYCEAAT